MTIESHLASIDTSLKLIAATLAGEELTTDNEEPGSEAAPKGSTEKAPAKKKAAAKKEAKEPEVPDGPKIEDVRAALTALQAAVGAPAARKLLASVGGSGALSKVKKAKYADIIEASAQALKDATDEEGDLDS